MTRYRAIYRDLRNHNGRLKSMLSTLAILMLCNWTIVPIKGGTPQVQLHGLDDTGLPTGILIAGSRETLLDACQASQIHALGLMDDKGKPNKQALEELFKSALDFEHENCGDPNCPIHGEQARSTLN